MKKMIEQLAKIYAEETSPENGYVTKECRNSDVDFCFQEARAAFKWLLKRYAIVDKDKAQADWQHYENDEFISARADDKEYNQWCKGAKHALQSILGNDLFTNPREHDCL